MNEEVVFVAIILLRMSKRNITKYSNGTYNFAGDRILRCQDTTSCSFNSKKIAKGVKDRKTHDNKIARRRRSVKMLRVRWRCSWRHSESGGDTGLDMQHRNLNNITTGIG